MTSNPQAESNPHDYAWPTLHDYREAGGGQSGDGVDPFALGWTLARMTNADLQVLADEDKEGDSEPPDDKPTAHSLLVRARDRLLRKDGVTRESADTELGMLLDHFLRTNNCWMDEGDAAVPSTCVLDDGRPEDCLVASMLVSRGESKGACPYWNAGQPIKP
jgi:hypothetical protein